MAVFTPINQEELISFLDQYEISKLIDFQGILEGIENSNFKIITEKENYILTIFEKRVNPEEIPFFIDLLSHLSKKNFPCPKPIKNKKGENINFLKGKSSILISFLEGQQKLTVSNNHCKQVGETLGLLHKNTNDFILKRENTMGLTQWETIIAKCESLNFHKYANMITLIRNELIFINKEWPEKLPTGVIHGDVFKDNVFFKNEKFSGLIDFYFSCNDFLAYDIAITTNAWCFDDNNFNKDKFIALISGYENNRRLQKDEVKKFSVLLRAASLRILITRLHDKLFHPEGAFVEPKNPEEYFLILKFHQQEDIIRHIK